MILNIVEGKQPVFMKVQEFTPGRVERFSEEGPWTSRSISRSGTFKVITLFEL
jgi:hypothetical protein